MAVNFVARKCACGGKLEFDPAKKIWICMYCGTVVEREATFDKIQIDGIEGISDVVRQTLMDVAENRLDSAAMNLEDCERKDHRHVGTLLANISYNLAMIAGAASSGEAGGYLDKVKIYAKRLREDFPCIAEDEINLYEEFGDSVANIYANLLVVFDTLGDQGRAEYIAARLRPEEIFSEYANGSLLRMSLRRGNYDMAEAVVRNTNHIDRNFGLRELLLHYPDNGRKQELLGLVFLPQAAERIPADFFDRYFGGSRDTLRTKLCVLRLLAGAGMRGGAENIVRALYPQMEGYESAREAFRALYETEVSDQETEAVLAFCIMESRAHEVIRAFLDALLERDVFVKLSSRAVISYLENAEATAEEKRAILERMFQLDIDGKAKDAVCDYYLNNNRDACSDRVRILDFLLGEGCLLSNATARKYIVYTSVDGEGKPAVVEKLFDTGLNRTYMGELLAEYLMVSRDQGAIKSDVLNCLLDKGFRTDSNVLARYLTGGPDPAPDRAERARRLIASGIPVRADCLENYILSIMAPGDFSEQIFDLLAAYPFEIGFNAYAKFLLFCQDTDKARHHARLADAVPGDISDTQTAVFHAGVGVTCNLLQAYVLITCDSYDAARVIVEELQEAKMKLGAEVLVNGSAVRFRKYVGERKASLSPLTLRLCEENRMFSLF